MWCKDYSIRLMQGVSIIYRDIVCYYEIIINIIATMHCSGMYHVP